MTQYWAIAVGINQYSQLQPPLMYAERDAAALYHYWLDDAQFEPDHCQLIAGDSADKDAIYEAIENVAQQATADDILWFTFSGYGRQADGEDYLLAVDSAIDSDLGNPTNAIALDDLMALLDKTPAQPVLFLDLKRLGHESDAELGTATLALAQQQGIPTILGCQPGQLSHETLTLRQGLFTTALLESLRQNGVALAPLGQDLRDRLPRLSDRHWRPVQTPMVFIPEAVRYQLLAPGKPAQIPPSEFDQGFDEGFGAIEQPDDNPPTSLPDLELGEIAEDSAEPARSLSGIELPPVPAASSPQLSEPSLPSVPTLPAPTPQITPRMAAKDAPAILRENSTSANPNHLLWRRVIPWGSALLTLLIFGVIVRNRAALFGSAPRDVRVDSVPGAVQPQPGDSDAANRAPSAPVPANQQVNAEILAQAIASLNQERPETPVNQASDFARAITIAERIQPGQPMYAEAQTYIQRWGNTVVDLAEARAQSGNYVDAIGAANLIPPSITAVYPRAQDRIQQWQQQLGQGRERLQPSVIASAQTLIQPGQASSYSQAIAHVRLVSRRDVDYDQAQTLIERWSTNILDLAYRRAYGGQFDSAIEAASLVPQDAVVYVDAREAIADWQWQLGLDADTNDQVGLLPDTEGADAEWSDTEGSDTEGSDAEWSDAEWSDAEW